jgi:type I restriction enzyme M protein
MVGPAWGGARISDILDHPSLDMKPRRLMPRALANIHAITSESHARLGDIADVVTATVDILR